MAILLTGSDAYAQLITVLIIFVAVLAVTAYTTKWIANYQKKQGIGQNIEVPREASTMSAWTTASMPSILRTASIAP